jgi:hypothetical protein
MNWGLTFWTLVLLVSLWWLVRQVHERLQELFYLLAGDAAIAIYLFQILLLPGVVLHEFSHYLTARLLRVRVRRVSLRPKVEGGKIQMGAVVMDRPDFFRGVLIGLAPLIVGSVAVVLIGQHVFDVGSVIEAAKASDFRVMMEAVRAAFAVNDAWIWFYLIFAISTAMLPSESDRESVWPMAVFVTVITILVVLAGWGPALMSSLATPVEAALSLLVVGFGVTLFVDAVFAVVIWVIRGSISHFTGRRFEKRAQ